MNQTIYILSARFRVFHVIYLQNGPETQTSILYFNTVTFNKKCDTSIMPPYWFLSQSNPLKGFPRISKVNFIISVLFLYMHYWDLCDPEHKKSKVSPIFYHYNSLFVIIHNVRQTVIIVNHKPTSYILLFFWIQFDSKHLAPLIELKWLVTMATAASVACQASVYWGVQRGHHRRLPVKP